jgi:hypothetical protein
MNRRCWPRVTARRETDARTAVEAHEQARRRRGGAESCLGERRERLRLRSSASSLKQPISLIQTRGTWPFRRCVQVSLNDMPEICEAVPVSLTALAVGPCIAGVVLPYRRVRSRRPRRGLRRADDGVRGDVFDPHEAQRAAWDVATDQTSGIPEANLVVRSGVRLGTDEAGPGPFNGRSRTETRAGPDTLIGREGVDPDRRPHPVWRQHQGIRILGAE